jgi:tetratricopeptide (TPR) repeat protein
MKIQFVCLSIVASINLVACTNNSSTKESATVEKDSIEEKNTEDVKYHNKNGENQDSIYQFSKDKDTASYSAMDYFYHGVSLLRDNGFFLSSRKDTLVYLEAAKYMEKAVSMDTSFVNGYTNLAQIYYQLDSNRLAIDALDRLLDISPDYIPAVTTKGFVFEKMGRMRDANLQYEKAITLYSRKLHPEYEDYKNKAFLIMLLHGEKAGIKELKKLREKYPDENVDLFIKQFQHFNREEFISSALN